MLFRSARVSEDRNLTRGGAGGHTRPAAQSGIAPPPLHLPPVSRVAMHELGSVVSVQHQKIRVECLVIRVECLVVRVECCPIRCPPPDARSAAVF